MVGVRTSPEGGGPRTDRLLRLCRSGLDSIRFRRQLRDELHRLVAFDAYCVNTADPATLLVTGSVGDGLPPEKTARLFAIEYAGGDCNELASLAEGPTHVATIGQATAGHPERSRRMREIFLPIGLGHEMRAALTAGGACWGFLHLLRRVDQPDFTEDDVRVVAAVAEPIAAALRVSLLDLSRASDAIDGPGIVTLRADGAVDRANPSAQHWLRELSDELHQPLPHALHVVAARVAANDASHASSCRLRTRSGEWLVVYGSRLGDSIAIVIERARSSEVAPVVLRAYGLTPREREVAGAAMRGLSNDDVAAALGLSTHTVKDHLKAIFEKVGVRSRGELVSRVFVDQVAPRIERGAPLGPDGGFED
jgi:DNA-binding CsgD family transcriptional regulator